MLLALEMVISYIKCVCVWGGGGGGGAAGTGGGGEHE